MQRYARDAKSTQQTQGDDALATEKSRYVIFVIGKIYVRELIKKNGNQKSP